LHKASVDGTSPWTHNPHLMLGHHCLAEHHTITAQCTRQWISRISDDSWTQMNGYCNDIACCCEDLISQSSASPPVRSSNDLKGWRVETHRVSFYEVVQ